MPDDEVFQITFADVEKTAEEFGRIAVNLPKHSMIIVMDDQLWGDGFIKQFEHTPYGMSLARRWAVRMEDEDLESNEPFEALRARCLADLEKSHRRYERVMKMIEEGPTVYKKKS